MLISWKQIDLLFLGIDFFTILINNHLWTGQSSHATKPLLGNWNKYFINGVL